MEDNTTIYMVVFVIILAIFANSSIALIKYDNVLNMDKWEITTWDTELVKDNKILNLDTWDTSTWKINVLKKPNIMDITKWETADWNTNLLGLSDSEVYAPGLDITLVDCVYCVFDNSLCYNSDMYNLGISTMIVSLLIMGVLIFIFKFGL